MQVSISAPFYRNEKFRSLVKRTGELEKVVHNQQQTIESMQETVTKLLNEMSGIKMSIGRIKKAKDKKKPKEKNLDKQ